MSDTHLDLVQIGDRVRKARKLAGISSLEKFADEIRGAGSSKRPSIAKLSRIETGDQPVPLDVLEPVASLTGIPEAELRPDLAHLAERFGKQTEAAE